MRSIETRISTAGVFRCCLSEDNWPDDQEYELEDTTYCRHCGRKFKLTDLQKEHPYWVPVEDTVKA